ncbi:hypothetical protein Q7M_94 [Borrelia crocidurae str. Achema]|uniref:Tetratricopeptide repeat family protein n=2 Tax=Borrelia crocidurae TaxID=29520 RepID=I0FBL7_BORCA|nr:hypothetical protein Q7M_94 [Borrelia crocidurae str. Achema]
MNMLRFFLFFFIFSFVLSLNSLGVKELPYWILIEKGRQLIYSKEGFIKSNLTDAINFLQEALLRKGIYPEANYYLSIVYSMIGNVVLQKLHLQKTLEDKDYLLDKSFEKNILFSLAKIAEIENNYVDMIDYLNEILSKFSRGDDYYNYHYIVQKYGDTSDNKSDMSFYLNSYLKQVRGTSGIDFTFNLYRFNNYGLIDTHKLLSKVYLKIGAHKLAITHGLVAAVGILTRMYHYINYYEPLYEFKNLRSFVKKINEYNDVKSSFESTDFWEIMYDISYATYIYDENKHKLRAVDTWKLIVDLAPRFSPYVLKSKIHIKNFLVNKNIH